jgi:hypothetical protein
MFKKRTSTDSTRPWRVIAHELTHEMNPRKVIALSQELNQALSQQRRTVPSERIPAQGEDVHTPEKSA